MLFFFSFYFFRPFYDFNVSFQTLTISVSVMTLCAISVERWYAICHPLRFHSTVRRARYIIIIIWIASACIAVPELITSTVVPLREDTVLLSACYPALWDDQSIVIFQICLMVGLYFLPIAMMAFSYSHIGLVLWRGSISETIELSKYTYIKIPFPETFESSSYLARSL
jgi:hypocretin (orexin) receptor 2